MISRFRAVLAYDGTAYFGFQRQPETPTIQGEVEQAITRVTGQEAGIIGAGRTDTGVHAVGQVIAFDVDWQHEDEALLRAINANLPEDIALQSIQRHPDFHPRFDAISRTYCYRVFESRIRQPMLINRVWQIDRKLKLDVMQVGAGLLVGEHDFATFGQAPQGNNTTRTVFRSEWTSDQTAFGKMLMYQIEATAFLQHMVRRIVGLLVKLGYGGISLQEFEEIFSSGDVSRVQGMAPPAGLVLEHVKYP